MQATLRLNSKSNIRTLFDSDTSMSISTQKLNEKGMVGNDVDIFANVVNKGRMHSHDSQVNMANVIVGDHNSKHKRVKSTSGGDDMDTGDFDLSTSVPEAPVPTTTALNTGEKTPTISRSSYDVEGGNNQSKFMQDKDNDIDGNKSEIVYDN